VRDWWLRLVKDCCGFVLAAYFNNLERLAAVFALHRCCADERRHVVAFDEHQTEVQAFCYGDFLCHTTRAASDLPIANCDFISGEFFLATGDSSQNGHFSLLFTGF
jgi:hypothetical protein